MRSKLGTRYYILVGLGLGLASSSLLALLYVGKTSFAETNLEELLAAPLLILITPIAIGLIIGVVLYITARDRYGGREVPDLIGNKQPLLTAETSVLGFGLGMFLGLIAGLVIFIMVPFAGRGFFSHTCFGFFLGGAIGSIIAPLSLKLEQWLR